MIQRETNESFSLLEEETVAAAAAAVGNWNENRNENRNASSSRMFIKKNTHRRSREEVVVADQWY